jgi:hypothetical protein
MIERRYKIVKIRGEWLALNMVALGHIIAWRIQSRGLEQENI